MPDVGTISVRMGVSLAEFQEGLKKATSTATSEVGLMSAEMKRQSREGAESMRLIDEAIGVHISRPLTRIIGQTQLLGPLLAGAFQLSAVAAIGAVFLEHGKAILEATGALEGWKELLGITGDSTEEVAKQIENGDAAVLASLHRKIEMQDAYNQLVLGLKGSDFEKQHVELLRQETAEIQKQVLLQNAKVAAAASEMNWQGILLAASRSIPNGTDLSGALGALGITDAADMEKSQAAANKLAEAMKPLYERLKQIDDEVQKDNWKIFRDGTDAAAAAAEHFQKRMLDFNMHTDQGIVNAAQYWKLEVARLEKLLPSPTNLPAEALGKFPSSISLAVGPPPGAAPLTDQMELLKIQTDQNEAWKKAGEILAQIETPMQKYTTGLAMLKELETEGRLSATQFAQAQQLLNEELAQSENRIEKLLKGGGASGGLEAFMIQMKGMGSKGSDGQFTFDLLNKGLQGFEDETVKALTGAKTSWASFFESLDQMILKFFLNKLVSQLFSGVGGLFNTGAAAGGSNLGGFSNVGSSGPTWSFASGTDFAPGGLSMVGEDGPELVNLPTGSSVTPNSALRMGGGPVVHLNIDARGGEIGVEDKIARAISESAPHIIMRAVVEAAENQRRTPR